MVARIATCVLLIDRHVRQQGSKNCVVPSCSNKFPGINKFITIDKIPPLASSLIYIYTKLGVLSTK